jgi:hypothetical protein
MKHVLIWSFLEVAYACVMIYDKATPCLIRCRDGFLSVFTLSINHDWIGKERYINIYIPNN